MWKQDKLLRQIEVVEAIKDYVVVSGGLAWHLMSPEHVENKYVHDHKDVDLFVIPHEAQNVFYILKARGYHKYWTKYDGISPDFLRYGKSEIRIEDETKPIEEQRHVKVLLDLFIETVPYVEVKGIKIVEPKFLLSLYKSKHTSGNCTAVQAARILTARGINPIGRKELIMGL